MCIQQPSLTCFIGNTCFDLLVCVLFDVIESLELNQEDFNFVNYKVADWLRIANGYGELSWALWVWLEVRAWSQESLSFLIHFQYTIVG